MTAQERRDNDLAASNTSLRKQASELIVAQAELRVRTAELEAQNAELEAKFATLEGEITTSKAARTASEAEVEANLAQMKSVDVDATLHARAELMEAFKASQHAEWDPDFKVAKHKLPSSSQTEKEFSLRPHSVLQPLCSDF